MNNKNAPSAVKTFFYIASWLVIIAYIGRTVQHLFGRRIPVFKHTWDRGVHSVSPFARYARYPCHTHNCLIYLHRSVSGQMEMNRQTAHLTVIDPFHSRPFTGRLLLTLLFPDRTFHTNTADPDRQPYTHNCMYTGRTAISS